MEENQIGKNVSGGAKKVEKIEREKRKAKEALSASAPAKKPRAKKPAAAKKEETLEHAAAKERTKAAKARLEKKEQKKLRRAELKQARIEKRAEYKAKKLEKRADAKRREAERKQKRFERAAAVKERRVERRAERIARREMLRNESKADRRARVEREKKEKLALRRSRSEQRERAREQRLKAREASRERRAENRRHRREQKTERRKHAPGFGGWLAAVISLGVACLALSTVVTAGAFRMNDITAQTANGYRSTLFEMVSVSEDMDSNLSKLRVSSGTGEQQKLLTELLTDTMLLESALERLPVDSVTGTDISDFVNRTGAYCRTLLSDLSAGGKLTEKERSAVEYLYNVNAGLYRELNELATNLSEKDFMAFIEGKEGNMSQKLGEIGRSAHGDPEAQEKAPFADEGNVEENKLAAEEELPRARCEELAREYFGAYHIADVLFTGETVAKSAPCYNFTLTDENGGEIFAQITKNGGKLAFFDSYEECAEKNFDLDTCSSLAEEFLAGLGITDVEAVWLSDGGMVADLTYVAVQNGVRMYPDLIRVRVCESRGRVVGMDAMNYLVNHGERTIGSTLSREEAQEKLSAGLTPYAAHLAVIPLGGREVLAHEFACTYGEEEYVVYLDAETGEELQVFRIVNSERGRYLR